MKNNYIISERDYKRIFETIYSVLSFDSKDINKECIKFNSIGAIILNTHHKLDAKLYAGKVIFKLNDAVHMAFGEIIEDKFKANNEHFHTWIGVDDWIIDFTAPLHANIFKQNFKDIDCKPYMFQATINQIYTDDDFLEGNNRRFYLGFDEKKYNEIINEAPSNLLFRDQTELCYKWYKKYPSAIKKYLLVEDENKKEIKIYYQNYNIQGNFL